MFLSLSCTGTVALVKKNDGGCDTCSVSTHVARNSTRNSHVTTAAAQEPPAPASSPRTTSSCQDRRIILHAMRCDVIVCSWWLHCCPTCVSARQEGMSAIDKAIAIFDGIHPCHILSCAFIRNRERQDKMAPGQTERITSCTDGH